MNSININTQNKKRIDFALRIAISEGLKHKDSITFIAKQLGFSRQAIYDELARGTREHMNYDLSITTFYDPYAAEYYHQKCSSFAGRIDKLDNELREIIISYLDKKYSPEVITHLIKTEYNGKYDICFKTIYNWINNNKLGFDKEAYIYKRKKNKKHKREKKLEKPTGGESIDYRLDLSDREEFGHWEIDCVVGKRSGKSCCLMTLVERKTRYGIVIRIQRKSKKCIVNALKSLKKKYGKYFYDIFKTITADNGSEFKDALGMSISLKNGNKIKIYYAHAYSSWERGTNENYNKMIRRWFPKGTNFINITQSKIDEVTNIINNYPRKIFNFNVAHNLFDNELLKIMA